MESAHRNDEQVQAAVKALFIGVAPERKDDLLRLWDDYQLQFRLFDDANGPMLEAGAYRYVHFNHRTLRVVWVAAFAAWEAYRSLADAVAAGTVPSFKRLQELLQLALAVREAKDPEAVSLLGLPAPGHLPDGIQQPQERTAAELAMFATGWALLHEVKHLQHQQTGTSSSPEDPAPAQRGEELSCDEFATVYLIEKLGGYSQATCSDEALVRRKRHMGIYFAMFALAVLAYPRWGASESHPSIQERIRATRELLDKEANEEAFLIAALAFTSLRLVWSGAPGM